MFNDSQCWFLVYVQPLNVLTRNAGNQPDFEIQPSSYGGGTVRSCGRKTESRGVDFAVELSFDPVLEDCLAVPAQVNLKTADGAQATDPS